MKTSIYTSWENHMIGGCALNHGSLKRSMCMGNICVQMWDVHPQWLWTGCDTHHDLAFLIPLNPMIDDLEWVKMNIPQFPICCNSWSDTERIGISSFEANFQSMPMIMLCGITWVCQRGSKRRELKCMKWGSSWAYAAQMHVEWWVTWCSTKWIPTYQLCHEPCTATAHGRPTLLCTDLSHTHGPFRDRDWVHSHRSRDFLTMYISVFMGTYFP